MPWLNWFSGSFCSWFLFEVTQDGHRRVTSVTDYSFSAQLHSFSKLLRSIASPRPPSLSLRLFPHVFNTARFFSLAVRTSFWNHQTSQIRIIKNLDTLRSPLGAVNFHWREQMRSVQYLARRSFPEQFHYLENPLCFTQSSQISGNPWSSYYYITTITIVLPFPNYHINEMMQI